MAVILGDLCGVAKQRAIEGKYTDYITTSDVVVTWADGSTGVCCIEDSEKTINKKLLLLKEEGK